MITIFQTAFELQDFCDRRGWSSCFIGGIAVQRWGQARVTRDVDIALLTGFGGEDSFIGPLLAQYAPRNTGAAQFARRSRVLLLRSSSGIGISLGGLPFEHLVVRRAALFEFAPGLDLRICSAEDLMVMKLFASRAIVSGRLTVIGRLPASQSLGLSRGRMAFGINTNLSSLPS